MVEIIAEISANHGHDINVLFKTIDAAKDAGATAIKIQSYTPEMLAMNVDNADFVVTGGTLWDNRTLFDLYTEAAMPWDWHQSLFDYCNQIGIELFSTPFDEYAVEYLQNLGVRRFKVASAEITHMPLLEAIANTGKPVILSTGMALKNEIEAALNVFKHYRPQDVTLLKCTSAYPTPDDEINLDLLKSFKEYGVKIGLSDHTLDNFAAILSVTYGVELIEKHFILDRSIGGPDASFSIQPNELKKLVDDVRRAEIIKGKNSYELSKSQYAARNFMRSIYVNQPITKGEVFSKLNIKIVRPSYSLSPINYQVLLGREAKKSYQPGDRIDENEIL